MATRCKTPGVSRHIASSVTRDLDRSLHGVLAHADAVLRRIDKDEPDLDEVVANLRAIQDAGRRAADFVHAVRSTIVAAVGQV